MAPVFQTRVDSQLTLSFDEFPREDRVTWKYYTGLIAMERLKFREAEECLSYALEQSDCDATRNIQKILFLLIPVAGSCFCYLISDCGLVEAAVQ